MSLVLEMALVTTYRTWNGNPQFLGAQAQLWKWMAWLFKQKPSLERLYTSRKLEACHFHEGIIWYNLYAADLSYCL